MQIINILFGIVNSLKMYLKGIISDLNMPNKMLNYILLKI